MTEIVPSYERAAGLAQSMIATKRAGRFPFDNPKLFPDEKVPEGIERGSLDHRVYLFHAISLDAGRQATLVYSAMQYLAEEVDLKQVHKISKSRLLEFLEPMGGVDSIDKPASILMHNSRILNEKYGGDPANIRANTIWGTIENIDAFAAYGVPKSALLMKNYVRFGIWDFPITEIPIKIDRHLLRICAGYGVIDIEKYALSLPRKMNKSMQATKEQLIRKRTFTQEDFDSGNIKILRTGKLVVPLTKTFMQVTKDLGISAIELDDAKWGIGSNLCDKNNGYACVNYCGVGCNVRYSSDNNCCWLFLGADKRRFALPLFHKGEHKRPHSFKRKPKEKPKSGNPTRILTTPLFGDNDL